MSEAVDIEVPASFERPGAEMDKRKGDIPPAKRYATKRDKPCLEQALC